MGKWEARNTSCVICARPYKLEDHLCKVTGRYKEKGKVCIHIKVKCANCRGGHFVNSNLCTQRYKAEVHTRKNILITKGKGKMNEVSANLSEAILSLKPAPIQKPALNPKPVLA